MKILVLAILASQKARTLYGQDLHSLNLPCVCLSCEARRGTASTNDIVRDADFVLSLNPKPGKYLTKYFEETLQILLQSTFLTKFVQSKDLLCICTQSGAYFVSWLT
jgi:hypothetical protein